MRNLLNGCNANDNGAHLRMLICAFDVYMGQKM